jgi:hypothetical protein
VEFALLKRISSDSCTYPREVWGEIGGFNGLKVNALAYPREVWGEMAYYQ